MNPSQPTFRSILVPYDFSQHAEAALQMAAELARQFGAELHLLNVIQPPSFAYGNELLVGAAHPIMGVREEIERHLKEVADGMHGLSVDVYTVEGTPIAQAIDDTAELLEADLIVMATHGRTGIAHVLMGSVTERALRHAPCPVLAVPVRATPTREGIPASEGAPPLPL